MNLKKGQEEKKNVMAPQIDKIRIQKSSLGKKITIKSQDSVSSCF